MNKRKTREKQKKQLNRISLVILTLLLAATSYWIYRISARPDQGTEPEKTPVLTVAEEPMQQETGIQREDADKSQVIPYILPFFEQNKDTVGYIKIGDTMVNYPVVYSGDNEYYMTHTFEGGESKEGAIFMDFRCDYGNFAKTRNIILYGHRMKDGSMFKGLTDYLDKGFYEANKKIRFDTLYEKYEWEVFAVFETTIDFYYIDTDFVSDAEWMSFMKTCHNISKYQEDITFYPTDIVLTLSTCGLTKNKRFVVMARLKS